MDNETPEEYRAKFSGEQVDHITTTKESHPYFRESTKLAKSTRVYWFNEGGLGDLICRIPALKYVLNRNPHLTIIIYVPRFTMLLISLFLAEYIQSKQLIIRDDATYPQSVEPGLIIKEFRNAIHTTMGTHLIAHAFNLLADETPEDPKDMLYPQSTLTPKQTKDTCKKFNINPSQPFILITPTYTSSTREWPSNQVLELCNIIKSAGITPVFIGSDKPMISDSRYFYKGNTDSNIVWDDHGINLLNKTELHEVLALCHHARAICGVDNGLLHLAACTTIPIVFGYTTVKPHHRRPFRDPNPIVDITPHPNIRCRFCQSNMRMFLHDFRNCIYEDSACTQSMTAKKFAEGLEVVGVLESKEKEDDSGESV